jgi:hypothetical protein
VAEWCFRGLTASILRRRWGVGLVAGDGLDLYDVTGSDFFIDGDLITTT